MDPILGSIILFAGSFAPVGYALCDGSTLQIAQNAALSGLALWTLGWPAAGAMGLIVGENTLRL